MFGNGGSRQVLFLSVANARRWKYHDRHAAILPGCKARACTSQANDGADLPPCRPGIAQRLLHDSVHAEQRCGSGRFSHPPDATREWRTFFFQVRLPCCHGHEAAQEAQRVLGRSQALAPIKYRSGMRYTERPLLEQSGEVGAHEKGREACDQPVVTTIGSRAVVSFQKETTNNGFFKLPSRYQTD